jgi:hypothetical protein
VGFLHSANKKQVPNLFKILREQDPDQVTFYKAKYKYKRRVFRRE